MLALPMRSGGEPKGSQEANLLRRDVLCTLPDDDPAMTDAGFFEVSHVVLWADGRLAQGQAR